MSERLDPRDFPALSILTDNWTTIRDECAALSRTEALPVDREGKSHLEVMQELLRLGRTGWVKSWGPMKDLWWNYGLGVMGQFPWPLPQCPETVSLLKRLRGVKVAALSLFRPQVCLLPHRHPELRFPRMLIYHLGLEMADDYNYLHTAGKFVREEEGKAIVFDGAETHYAFNFSDRDRLILYLEFSPDRLALI